jgi:hypothetical protein
MRRGKLRHCKSDLHGAGADTETWRPIVDPEDWRFSETARCGAGHKLRFDDACQDHIVERVDLLF